MDPYPEYGLAVDTFSGVIAFANPDCWEWSRFWVPVPGHRVRPTRSTQGYAMYGPARAVPESCIKSAEYVMRYHAIVNKGGLQPEYVNESSAQPHVCATFGGRIRTDGKSREVNITEAAHADREAVGMKGYPFKRNLPPVGEGIMIGNVTTKKVGKYEYNMHFGAIVAIHNTRQIAVITDVEEIIDEDEDEEMTDDDVEEPLVEDVKVKVIRVPDDFRDHDMRNRVKFRLGSLTVRWQ